MKAERLAKQRLHVEAMTDENLWWNKIKTMTDYELDMLPHGFTKKYGTFVSGYMA